MARTRKSAETRQRFVIPSEARDLQSSRSTLLQIPLRSRLSDYKLVPSSHRSLVELCGLHGFLGAFRHLLRGHVFHVSRNAPEMSEGIPDKAGAVSIELVFDRFLDLRSLRDRFCYNFVDIRQVHIQTDRRSTDSLSAPMSHLQVFVRQHDARVADLQLSVADLAVGTIHAHNYGRSENVLVVVDRLRRALDDEVRRNGVISLGNVADFAHSFLLDEKVEGWRLKQRGRDETRHSIMRTQIGV